MYLKSLELQGFKSFAKKTKFIFDVPIIAIVGPNGSGKSNVVEAIRFVLGEQSVKSMRGKTGSDLIFKGSRKLAKMSRASVEIVFDNRDRVFHLHQQNNEKINIDFDEVAIRREVFSDGSQKYLINGHEVRMRDIHELIASIHIGASGHHIISQGEADRYLNANAKERRLLIEEALGLKVFQYRIKESLKRLEKAKENIRESQLLRRELAPHLKFLKKQVDKIEKSKLLREELYEEYQNYFSREDFLIRKKKKKIEEQSNKLEEKETQLTEKLSRYKDMQEKKEFPESSLILAEEKKREELHKKKSKLLHQLGNIEGMLSLLRESEGKETREIGDFELRLKKSELETLFSKIIHLLENFASLGLEQVIREVKLSFQSFLESRRGGKKEIKDNSQKIIQLEEEKARIDRNLDELKEEENEIQGKLIHLRFALEEKEKERNEAQRRYYELLAEQKELEREKTFLSESKSALERRQNFKKMALEEAENLLGKKIFYDHILLEDEHIFEEGQDEHFRKIERLKIRLEDMGTSSGEDIIREYEEVLKRDNFLQREIEDTEQTILSLTKLIEELKDDLSERFRKGIQKINLEFRRFFQLMFGGGEARLEEVVIQKRRKKRTEENQGTFFDDEEEEKEFGLDIKVALPRKKVSDLDMLSGGERSLTSIALLFALSQVNPPPFLILDETDAALDEANSKKYGDMVEALSQYSQLILVTHNRETMSRAHTLFGITLGSDDSSRMLSLRLEDATQYAK